MALHIDYPSRLDWILIRPRDAMIRTQKQGRIKLYVLSIDADERQLVWGTRGYLGVIVGLPVTIIGESLTEPRPYPELGCWQA